MQGFVLKMPAPERVLKISEGVICTINRALSELVEIQPLSVIVAARIRTLGD